MAVAGLVVAFVLHNLLTERSAAHLLVGFGIAERTHDEVVFVGHHHELHTWLPVAQTVELEVHAHEVRHLFMLCAGAVCRCLYRILHGRAGFYYIGIGLG